MPDRQDLEDAVDAINAKLVTIQADIDALKAASPAAAGTTDDDSPLEARVKALEVAVFPPQAQDAQTDPATPSA